jgi:carboxypeptidase Taq
MSTTDAPASEAEASFLSLWADIEAIGSAAGVLGWDQETYMPPKGQPRRGQVLATLAGLGHDKLTSPELADVLAAAETEAGGDPDGVLAAQTREARRTVTRASAIPADLTRRVAGANSRALAAWRQAREDNDFKAFEDDLATNIALTKESAGYLVDAGIADDPYDALLDGFEPGATRSQLTPLLRSLRDELSPIVRAAADSGIRVDETPAKGFFPTDAQFAFGHMVAEQMGYDFEAGRLDVSAHPFTTGFGPKDVRITWRSEEEDFRPGLFGIMHEAGHALYEQGLPDEWAGTPIGNAVSLGVHESQSRLWENLVGRSRPFWQWALPRFAETFPSKADVTVDALWPALHTCVPSLIRVEADEATYNLHIVARFEIEQAIFDDEVEVGDLPTLWDDTYEELLGVRSPVVADGVLQDIHWSMGAFGYFPTYTLGNLINAQLFATMRETLDTDALLAAGDLRPILEWLRENVHRHGRRYPAPELVERATGRPLTADYFLSYLRGTMSDVYGINA